MTPWQVAGGVRIDSTSKRSCFASMAGAAQRCNGARTVLGGSEQVHSIRAPRC